MRTPEFNALRATAATSATPALAWRSRQADGGGFNQVFSHLQAEVSQVIDKGWPASPALPALDAEGWLRRAGAGTGTTSAQAAIGATTADGEMAAGQQEFLAAIAPWAREAGASLGVSPELVAAHAALESGWGSKPLRDAAGRDSHNLFGVKAQGWNGARVEALTTEVEGGVALKKTESFRQYPDVATAFRDYARMLQDNPRYRGALNVGSNAEAFAQGLARGGYATDPAYAAKLTRLATQLQSAD